MGSMISEDHFNTVNGYIQKGIDEGASLLHGGVATGGSKGSFVYPTLFDNLKEDIKTPFGGYKQSGSLSRDNGTEALDQYLQIKTIWFTLK